MSDEIQVQLSTKIIADPVKLLREIDALPLSDPPTMIEYVLMLKVRDLIRASMQTETVALNIDSKNSDRYGQELMDHATDILREKLGERLVRVVSPVTSVIRKEV